MKLSHVDDQGRSRMVDISSKPGVSRAAEAEAKVFISPKTYEIVSTAKLPKGNPFEIARVAGVLAAKDTSRLIPLCHDLSLDFVDVDIALERTHFIIRSKVKCRWATGVEMEALTAVSMAALTLYDMCKAVDKKMKIGDIQVTKKQKG
jgi:cyclic pyranopterin phosphate synthase